MAPGLEAYHATRALLAEPAIGILPISGQDEDVRRVEELGWKGAAFYGSMLAGGAAGKAVTGLLAKGLASGAAGGGTFELFRQIPLVMDDAEHGLSDVVTGRDRERHTPTEALRAIGTAAAWGALTGGAISKIPFAVRTVGKVAAAPVKGGAYLANRAIDVIPGGPEVRAKTQQFVSAAYRNLWDKFFTSGQEILKKAGLEPMRLQLNAARSIAALTGGRWVGNLTNNMKGLADDEVRQATGLMETHDLLDPGVVRQITGYPTKVVVAAVNEAKQLRQVGEILQKAGVQVYDPETGFHSFVLRKNYVPHRFVNPDIYRPGGEARDATIAQVAKKLQLTPERATEWVDAFADRVQAEQEGILSGKPISFGTSHFLKGRNLELPGYETDLRKILPQYYEYASRRLANHVAFGPVSPVENATQKAAEQMDLFPQGTRPEPPPQPGVPQAQQVDAFPGFRGHGIPEAETPRARTAQQIVYARQAKAEAELRRSLSLEKRYPRAFAQLEDVQDPGLKSLATTIVRRQLGGLEDDQFARGALPSLAKVEVVSKLALGAIAQPSQILSGIVRTGYRGAFGNLMKTLSNDPDALDFALRSGATLRGVVREAEASLTGKAGEDFLEKVGFTQMDLKSRVFGALQGASFAEQQASKLSTLSRLPRSVATQRAMEKIETRLATLGLDSAAIVQRGGTLTQDELLKAGQSVATDVNFWGDQLSLPEFYRSPWGRYVTMFKSFGLQQTKLVKDHVVKPGVEWFMTDGRKGDITPAIRFAMLTPAGGEVIADLKRLVRGRDVTRKDRDWITRILENISNGAGFGLAYDAFEATKYGLGGTLGWGLGPIGTELGRAATNIGSAARGDARNLAKQAIETGAPAIAAAANSPLTPLVAAAAPAVSNLLLPPGGK